MRRVLASVSVSVHEVGERFWSDVQVSSPFFARARVCVCVCVCVCVWMCVCVCVDKVGERFWSDLLVSSAFFVCAQSGREFLE